MIGFRNNMKGGAGGWILFLYFLKQYQFFPQVEFMKLKKGNDE